MCGNNRRPRFLVVGIAGLVFLAIGPVLGVEYTLTEILPTYSEQDTAAFYINDAGHVAGWQENVDRAIYWRPDTGTTLLGTLFGTHSSMATIISGADQVYGWSGDSVPPNQVDTFVWDSAHGMRAFGIPQGGYPCDVTHSGTLVGWCGGIGGGPRQPYQWTAAAGLTLLPLLPGHSEGVASGINEAGVVVGFSRPTGDPLWHPVVWRGGAPQLLPSLPGSDDSTVAQKINNANVIVGHSGFVAAGMRAVRWSPDLTIEALAEPNEPFGGSYAYDINDAGEVVGYFTSRAGGAAYWDPHGNFHRLEYLLHQHFWTWSLSTAHSVNAAGQIAAVGSGPPSYRSRGVVLTPLRRGDLNCDGVVDFGDIEPFVQILDNLAGWQAAYPNCPWRNGDCNGDTQVNFLDINPFVALLAGQ